MITTGYLSEELAQHRLEVAMSSISPCGVIPNLTNLESGSSS